MIMRIFQLLKINNKINNNENTLKYSDILKYEVTKRHFIDN